MSMYHYSRFPTQKNFLFDYSLDENGNLILRRYERYRVIAEKYPYDKPNAYRIHTGTNVIIKRFNELNIVKNNHILMETEDPEKAYMLFMQYHTEQAEKAKTTAVKHETILHKMQLSHQNKIRTATSVFNMTSKDHPASGSEATDFYAKLSENPKFDTYFRESKDIEMKHLTRGKVYKIYRLDFAGGAVFFAFMNDNKEETMLAQNFFEMP